MNKKLVIIIVLITIVITGFGQTLTQDTIIKIEFNYLPWKYCAPRRLNSDMVIDHYGRTSTYTITDSNIIEEFSNSLMIFNMKLFKEKEFIDIRMVIDFYFKSGKIETLLLSNRGMKYSDTFYHTNYYLMGVIEKYVPPASVPK